MRIVTLLENTACREGLCCAHGLSLYIETPRRRILFDMGPNGDFAANAAALGVDLAGVDLAVLSHGHYDHGGGLAAFCRLNSRAPIYIHRAAFGAYYALDPGRPPKYIGLSPELEAFRDRFILTGDETAVDGELTLFANPPSGFAAGPAGAKLREKTGEDYLPDGFFHEQDLLVTAEGKSVLFAGCAHRGVVNILAEAKRRLGRAPDALFGGFHLFELTPETEAADALIDATGKALLAEGTVYYTGHCTGPYAYERLAAILGDRLRPMTGGADVTL